MTPFPKRVEIALRQYLRDIHNDHSEPAPERLWIDWEDDQFVFRPEDHYTCHGVDHAAHCVAMLALTDELRPAPGEYNGAYHTQGWGGDDYLVVFYSKCRRCGLVYFKLEL